MVFITGLMGVFGVVSYFAFGDQTASIITLNLGDPKEDNLVRGLRHTDLFLLCSSAL